MRCSRPSLVLALTVLPLSGCTGDSAPDATEDSGSPPNTLRDSATDIEDSGKSGTEGTSDCTGSTVWPPQQSVLTVGTASAYLHIPATLPPCAPLVVFGHGGELPGTFQEGRWSDTLGTGLAGLADVRGFVLLVPGVGEDGLDHHVWSRTEEGATEVLSLVEAVWGGVDIDRSRTWYLGQSAGGFMGAWLGLNHPDPWSAVGVISAGLTEDYPDPPPTHLLPFFVAHDPNDAWVPYTTGQALVEELEDHGHRVEFQDWSLGSDGHSWVPGLSEAALDGLTSLSGGKP